MIHYVENKQITVEDLLPLYQSVGWSNYTDYPERLERAFQNSLYTVAAYDNDCLVGLLRAVGMELLFFLSKTYWFYQIIKDKASDVNSYRLLWKNGQMFIRLS